MQLREMYESEDLVLSYELYPPKTEKGTSALFDHLEELVEYEPSFITCTYGAGGSTSHRTLDILRGVKQRHGLPVAAHLTCVGATADELRAYLRQAQEQSVDHIVALRGDPPKGKDKFEAVEGGLHYASDLVSLVRSDFPGFGILVAGYPETHREAPNRQTDLDNLKRKVDCGADAVVTQLFYDNHDFFRFRDSCAESGIDVPIVPGVLPITNLQQVERITALCGANLPPALHRRLEAHADDPQGQFDVGVYHATSQVEELVTTGGCPGVHFYVLNKSRAAATILRALTLPPKYQKEG